MMEFLIVIRELNIKIIYVNKYNFEHIMCIDLPVAPRMIGHHPSVTEMVVQLTSSFLTILSIRPLTSLSVWVGEEERRWAMVRDFEKPPRETNQHAGDAWCQTSFNILRP